MVKISAIDNEAPTVDDSVPGYNPGGLNTKRWTLAELITLFFDNVPVDSANFLEIDRHTLGSSADALSVASLPAYKYIEVIAHVINSGGITAYFTFNNDTTATNYNRKVSDNNGANSDTAGAFVYTTTGTNSSFIKAQILNVATQNKLVMGQGVTDAGDGVAPTKRDFNGQWENNADAINRIDLLNDGAGSFDVGSELIIFGKN